MKPKVGQVWQYRETAFECTDYCCNHTRIISAIYDGRICFVVPESSDYNNDMSEFLFMQNCHLVKDVKTPKSGFAKFICEKVENK